jgi:hypothetical protein
LSLINNHSIGSAPAVCGLAFMLLDARKLGYLAPLLLLLATPLLRWCGCTDGACLPDPPPVRSSRRGARARRDRAAVAGVTVDERSRAPDRQQTSACARLAEMIC